jgi:hypothetical protein
MPPPQSNPSASAPPNNTVMAGSRSRPQARKKVNDDAAYFGPPTAVGVKRHATDKAEGEPRVKRKKVDATTGAAGRKAADKNTILEGGDLNVSLVSTQISYHVQSPKLVSKIFAHRLNSRACPYPRSMDTLRNST